MAVTYETSETGRYKVTLKKSFERRGYIYKASMDNIVVVKTVLDEMIAADSVVNAIPSD